MKLRLYIYWILITLLCWTSQATAWGPTGHKVVGGLGLGQLDKSTRHRLNKLMGTSDLEQLTDWCNWPDEYRATDDGAWSSPLHYVNIPRGTQAYDRARDCSQDLCVTEAIPRYVAELADMSLDRKQRQRAFGFVCHFVGDLSQTLHAGFGHDRGGNDFPIQFKGESLNLHEFWDHTLIERNSTSWRQLYEALDSGNHGNDQRTWTPALVVDWTNQSHQLAIDKAYPANPDITAEFASKSWDMIQSQLQVGGQNLALVLNHALDIRCRHSRH